MKKNKLMVCRDVLYKIYKRLKSVEIPFITKIKIKRADKAHERVIERIKDKPIYRCVFLALDEAVWKCDSIYRSMLENQQFEPIILVCPIVNQGYENMIDKMEHCYTMFQKKGYRVIKSYNVEKKIYIDLKSLSPDIIIYTNPYKGLIDSRYYITNFNNYLTVYIPYYINGTTNNGYAYNQLLHNLTWRYYVESPIHKKLAEKYSLAKGKNVIVTGYPGIEEFIDETYYPSDDWKVKDRSIKRIIWAPHQTIEIAGDVNYSCFLTYCDFMLEMARKYRNKIQIAFKPHPLLKGRLYAKWGKEQTDKYYSMWSSMDNTFISDSDYHDLFLTSDAMIHDCGSFTIEYLYLNKPVMRLMNSIEPKTMFGEFGLACINMHYLAYSEQEVEGFIVNVINGTDPMEHERKKFVNGNLMLGEKPSKRIICDIINSIKGHDTSTFRC